MKQIKCSNCGGKLDKQGTTCIYCGAVYKDKDAKLHKEVSQESIEDSLKTFEESWQQLHPTMQKIKSIQKGTMKSMQLGPKPSTVIFIFIIIALLFIAIPIIFLS